MLILNEIDSNLSLFLVRGSVRRRRRFELACATIWGKSQLTLCTKL